MGRRNLDVFDQKIRNKMLWRILATAAAILIALALVTFWITRALLAEELQEKSRARVELVASKIDRWLDEKGEVMKLLAAREGMQPSSLEFKQEYFRQIAKRYGGVESAYIGYPDGAFVTGADWDPPADYDPRKRPWYMAAAKKRDVTFSTPYRDAFTGRLVTTVAVPIARDGELVAVLGMDIFIDDLVRAVDSLKIGQSSHAYVVDREGLYIAHPDQERVLNEQIAGGPYADYFVRSVETLSQVGSGEGSARRSAIYDGDDDYILVSRILQPGWYLFFHLPKSEVNRPLQRLALLFMAGIGAALLVLAFTVSYISQRIAGPILALADGAGEIAEGSYDRRLEVSSRDEVGYLTKSFNDMAEGLKDREFIRATFGRYVSEDVMRDILEGNLQLGGQSMEVTVLFSDIRDFTRLSETMDARELVEMLNAYFSRMERAITACGGSINKYLGDGIMAMFGAPARLESSALAAVDAAWAMLRDELPALNRELGRELRIGIGIHTGEAVVGNIGSEQRTEYTIIGDAVNSASRIESLTKQYGEPLLISEATAERLPEGDWVLRTIDRVRVKGKMVPLTLWTPYRGEFLTDLLRERIAVANRIMEHYFAGDLEQAIAELETMEERDLHLETIYRRCREFGGQVPPDWDGVYTMDSK